MAAPTATTTKPGISLRRRRPTAGGAATGVGRAAGAGLTTVTVGDTGERSSSRKAEAEAVRSCGALASACMTAVDTAAGTSGRSVWGGSGWWLITNSAVVTTITLVICLTIGSLAAYGFSRFRFRGRTPLLLFYLVIRMFPVVLLIIPLFIIMRDLGLLGKHLGLALTYTTFLLPLCVWLMKGFFDAIPIDLEESARIDGCTEWDIYRRVIMPLSRPALATVGLFTFINAWNDFNGPLIYLNDERKATLSLGLQQFVSQHGAEWSLLMAASTLMTIPIILIFFFAQRTFIQGIALSGLKG